MTQAILNDNGFATISGKLTTYVFHHETKEYLFKDDPFIAIGTGIPGSCTLIAPPEAETGFAFCWDGKEWRKTEDHRGETIYSETDGSPAEVKQLGTIPNGYTTQTPPVTTQAGETLTWTGSTWLLTPPSLQRQALTKYQQGVSQCSNMAPQGKTPSEQMQDYYQKIWKIAYLQTTKTSASVQLNAVAAPVQTLPNPPAGLGNPNDPNSGWWV